MNLNEAYEKVVKADTILRVRKFGDPKPVTDLNDAYGIQFTPEQALQHNLTWCRYEIEEGRWPSELLDDAGAKNFVFILMSCGYTVEYAEEFVRSWTEMCRKMLVDK